MEEEPTCPSELPMTETDRPASTNPSRIRNMLLCNRKLACKFVYITYLGTLLRVAIGMCV